MKGVLGEQLGPNLTQSEDQRPAIALCTIYCSHGIWDKGAVDSHFFGKRRELIIDCADDERVSVTRELVWVHTYDVIDVHARKDRDCVPSGGRNLDRAHPTFSAICAKYFKKIFKMSQSNEKQSILYAILKWNLNIKRSEHTRALNV